MDNTYEFMKRRDKPMKRIIFFMLLSSFGLCSCANTLQVKTSTYEPSGTQTIQEDATTEYATTEYATTEYATTEYATIEYATIEYATIEDSTDTEYKSNVFMGEIIMAPGHYPGVPDVYTPVLDDLYLYEKLSSRNKAMHYEGNTTQEVEREYENVLREIWTRGYLPYPGDGLGITGGYALVDLDGDGSPELLILDNSPYYMKKPVIKSVFAIREGELACIDHGSTELNYTTLAADNTFYQCIDWRGAGYADLRVFRLEAGMSEFTIITEARASLSFSDGDVPVPYWVKIENGSEIKISEDEFNVLLKQYKHAKELMVLDFVPLHPDAIDPCPVPRPGEELTMIPVEYPQSYPGAPEEYKPILDALFLLEELMRREEYGFGEDLEIVGFVEYPHDSTLGYALIDLNNDGVLELLLGSIDGLNNSAPNSVFILKDGQPVLLTSFWSRSRGVVTADGTIYSMGSGGAAYTYLSSLKLDKNSNTLTELTNIRSDYSFLEEKPYYFQVMDGRNHYIPYQEFFDFCMMYDNPPDRMKLTFIPIVP